MVKLAVHDHSDALVDLYLGEVKLEAGADGLIEVKLVRGQARVMAKAAEDPDLYAGASKKKTWLIKSADGATVGDDDWYTVTATANHGSRRGRGSKDGCGGGAGAAVDCAVAARAGPAGWRRTAAVSAAAAGLVEPIVPESPGG